MTAVGADLGVVFDRAGERLYLVDEQAREVPVEQALLLFLRLLGSNGNRGKLAFPITVTSQVEELVKGSHLEVIRTPASLAELTKAAAEDGVIFAGAVGGGYVFPRVPARLRRGLQPLQAARAAGAGRAAALGARGRAAREHARPPAGAVPVVAEGDGDARPHRAAAQPRGRPLDGIKLFDQRGWAQVLPDPDEPVVHIYAEGKTEEDSLALEAELQAMVEEIMQGDQAEAEAASLKVRLTLMRFAA